MIGEREVASLSTPLGKKVRLAYRRAQSFVGLLSAWRHLRTVVTTNALNWVNDRVTLPAFLSVYSAVYAPSDTLRYELRCINPETLKYKARTSPLISIPEYYAIVGQHQVQFYPQPTVAMLAQINVDLLLAPTIASAATDVIEGPDSYVDLVSLYAQIVMHRVHTTDLNAAEATLREFETSVHMYRTLNVLTPISFM
jgi:hypothetical protein